MVCWGRGFPIFHILSIPTAADHAFKEPGTCARYAITDACNFCYELGKNRKCLLYNGTEVAN